MKYKIEYTSIGSAMMTPLTILLVRDTVSSLVEYKKALKNAADNLGISKFTFDQELLKKELEFTECNRKEFKELINETPNELSDDEYQKLIKQFHNIELISFCIAPRKVPCSQIFEHIRPKVIQFHDYNFININNYNDIVRLFYDEGHIMKCLEKNQICSGKNQIFGPSGQF